MSLHLGHAVNGESLVNKTCLDGCASSWNAKSVPRCEKNRSVQPFAHFSEDC